uniref:Uncharacterized protein n=1 Tax=Mycena chlorophos TaxID=658473 RepID=A0ABQ0KZA0_MYCCL|nr:predicted protein [Mycena chlorophos]
MGNRISRLFICCPLPFPRAVTLFVPFDSSWIDHATRPIGPDLLHATPAGDPPLVSLQARPLHDPDVKAALSFATALFPVPYSCSNCGVGFRGSACVFRAYGDACMPCKLLGTRTSCSFVDLNAFLDALAWWQEDFLETQFQAMCAAIRASWLTTAEFADVFQQAFAASLDIAQGAIDGFELNRKHLSLVVPSALEQLANELDDVMSVEAAASDAGSP